MILRSGSSALCAFAAMAVSEAGEDPPLNAVVPVDVSTDRSVGVADRTTSSDNG